MRVLIKLLFALPLLTSCATIINSPYQKVNIDHDPSISVKIDTSKYYYRESDLYNVYIPKNYTKQNKYFLRCENEIPLIINNSDTLKLKPHRSYFAYWFANLYMTAGLGMIVDYSNDKSFEYPIYNYIMKVNDRYQNVRFKPIPENTLYVSCTMPTINGFYLQTDTGKRSTASGLGFSAQLEYFLRNNYYLSFNFGSTFDLFSAAPDSIDLRSRYFVAFDKYSSSDYLNIRINKITPRFEYGVGITLSSLKWSSNNIIKSTDSTRFYSRSYYRSIDLGLSSAISYRLTPNLNFGLQYQPLFFDVERKKFSYQHFITAQFIWRIYKQRLLTRTIKVS